MKNIVFKATVLPALKHGLSNFNLPDQNKRAMEAERDVLNAKLYENMGKPPVDRDIWNSYKGYHRSELSNPNIIEWIQAKRLRALYRAVEPTIQTIKDTGKDLERRHEDMSHYPIPWYYEVLLSGIDPWRDGT